MEPLVARELYNQMCFDKEDVMSRFGVLAVAMGAPTYALVSDYHCTAAAKFLSEWADALNSSCKSVKK